MLVQIAPPGPPWCSINTPESGRGRQDSSGDSQGPPYVKSLLFPRGTLCSEGRKATGVPCCLGLR